MTVRKIGSKVCYKNPKTGKTSGIYTIKDYKVATDHYLLQGEVVLFWAAAGAIVDGGMPFSATIGRWKQTPTK